MQLQHAAAAAPGIADGQQQRPYIAVPFHIDCFLPEFLVSAAAYEAGVRHSWLPGDRFRTYNGPQQQHQVRWHTLTGLLQRLCHISAVAVLAGAGRCMTLIYLPHLECNLSCQQHQVRLDTLVSLLQEKLSIEVLHC
jgi:hypothetical protein